MIERHPTPERGLHPLRKTDLTASVFGALAGLHPYKTLGELYAEKAHGIDFGRDETMAMRRGRILEPAVAAAVAEERPGWKIWKACEYIRDSVLRLGCTPDFYIIDERGRRGVLQAKTCTKLVFDKHWGDSPPPWIALQNAIEIMLDDAEFGCIAALIVDGYHFDVRLYVVDRHPGAEQRAREMTAKFWLDVDAGVQPKIDYERDGALIALMYPAEVEGKMIDLRGDNRLPDLLDEIEQLAAEIKQRAAAKEVAENEVKFKMGDAEIALLSGWRLTFRAQTRKAHQVKESTFRVLRMKREDEAA